MSSVIVLEDRLFKRWLNHKVRGPMNGISALIKEAPESSLAISAMWGYRKKMAIFEIGPQ